MARARFTLWQVSFISLIFFALSFGFLIFILPTVESPCKCDTSIMEKNSANELADKIHSLPPNNVLRHAGARPIYAHNLHEDDKPEWGDHRLAIIVPFRDRFEELLEFAPHLHSYLNRKKVRHKFFIINQVDNLRYVTQMNC